jgi:threonylcarbamoyladenosine tRNA methylthiotransferase MtaB
VETKKFKVVSLGCRTNQYESQAYTDQLLALGMQQASDDETAEICVVNTCTVTESADSSSRHQIRLLAKQNPGAKILVTGCLAERDPSSLQQIEGVLHVVSNTKKESLLSTIFPQEDLPEFSIKNFDAHTRAFVKVQDGCNSFCTYCIIPYVRGRSRSRRLDDITKEIETLVSNGFKEVVLTGINIGDFDGAPAQGETPVRLAELVRRVDQIEGIERIRISSIDPDEIDDELIDAVVQGKHTCHSLHIVLQSGSNVVLKRMNRKYTKEIFLSTIERLRKVSPDFTFTTDIIVGFPGESQEDFQDTIDLMKHTRFAKVHMFPYSERKRTRAALFSGKVPHQVMQERKREVLTLAEHVSYKLREDYIGRKMTVLLESEEKDQPGFFSSHTANFLPVIVEGSDLSANQLIEVELIANTEKGLIGRRI